jgi:hypothetical protein
LLPTPSPGHSPLPTSFIRGSPASLEIAACREHVIYAGSGLPFVSGANQITTIPTTYTSVIVAIIRA